MTSEPIDVRDLFRDCSLSDHHAIFQGDIPFLTLSLDDADGNPVPIGKLWGKGGTLSFTGDVDESARIFFEEIMRRGMHYLKKPE